MKTFYCLFAFQLIFRQILFAQPYINVMISNQYSPNEVSICINPKSPGQLAAGANLSNFYNSLNGGLNWGIGVLTSSQYGVWGDPCVVVDTLGNFYYFHLSFPPSGGSWIDRIVCQKSTNGGASWSNPGTYMGLNPPKKQDKEWACVDWTKGPRGNWIYVTWTQFDNYGSHNTLDSSNILFARSANGGASWTPAKRINKLAGDCIDGDNTVEGAVPCVGPNGEIYVSWAGPKVVNSQYGIFFDKSTDGGNTWLDNDIYVTDQPGGWDFPVVGIYRCNGLPVTCCDISSGPYRGHIYINWSDQRSGAADTDVWLIKSTNGGLNWSNVRRVNNDPPGKHQFFTWMTIDQTTGYLYFVFYDRRVYTDYNTDVYIARSTDGGSTFANIKVSSSPFLPNPGVFFGDYNNITAASGKVRPMWTRMVNSNLSVWTALVEFPIGIQPAGNELPEEYKLYQNYPNPFNPVTKITFDIPHFTKGGQGGLITMTIYDVLGREIATIISEPLNPGTYEIEWNGTNYNSGIYFYKLTADEFAETKKMILIK